MDKPVMEKPMMEKKAMHAAADIRDSAHCNPNGVALAGVDVVSYFRPGGPLIGSAEFAAEHEGLSFYFLNAANREAFLADPEAYLPEYMGWCATSLANGALTCPNPLNYKIERGRLLLFETTGFTNGRHVWNSAPRDHRRRADRHQRDFLNSGR